MPFDVFNRKMENRAWNEVNQVKLVGEKPSQKDQIRQDDSPLITPYNIATTIIFIVQISNMFLCPLVLVWLLSPDGVSKRWNMSRLRAFSSPDLVPSDSGSVTSPTRTTEHQSHETSGLEGNINHITFYILILEFFLL